jgi:hypothetical protein
MCCCPQQLLRCGDVRQTHDKRCRVYVGHFGAPDKEESWRNTKICRYALALCRCQRGGENDLNRFVQTGL